MSIHITEHGRDLVILDIDGCLLDSDSRLPHLLAGDRETYDSLHPTDRTWPAGHAVYRMFQRHPDVTVLFVTARQENARHYTMEQLNRALGSSSPVMPWQLLMRPTGCSDPDIILKPRLIEEAGWSLERILVVVEDSDATVAMWRSKGIECWQPRSSTHNINTVQLAIDLNTSK